MTSFRIEHLTATASARGARVARFTREEALDQLAGRTIWCGVETPGSASTRMLDIPAGEALRELAARLDGLLSGAFGDVPLGAAERELCDHAADMVATRIGRDDIVLLHDALSALLAAPVREQGAHAVWLMRASSEAPARPAPSFLPPLTSAVDAYVTTWRESVAALMPSADVVTVISGPDAELDWTGVLADVVEADRLERVGGALHARPAVAAR